MAVAGTKSLPITLKLSTFGTELELHKYTNQTVMELLDQVASISGLDSNKIKLKVLEETQTRRIDQLIYLKETLTLPLELRVLNTLFDVKMKNNSVLMVEEKNDDELVEDGQDVSDAVENIDDSDNMRTVIVNVQGFEEFERYQVQLDWNLIQLRDFLVEKLQLGGEQRLRELTDGRLFYKEEMENKLRNYERFREGGTRL